MEKPGGWLSFYFSAIFLQYVVNIIMRSHYFGFCCNLRAKRYGNGVLCFMSPRVLSVFCGEIFIFSLQLGWFDCSIPCLPAFCLLSFFLLLSSPMIS